MKLFPEEVERRREIARMVAAAYQHLPGVCAIFSWGSTASGQADKLSDVDIGVYTETTAPAARERLAALEGIADDPAAIDWGRFGRLEAFDKFRVQDVPVFVAWWRVRDEEAFIRRRLRALLASLGDREAENELGELQRALILWDPLGALKNLRGTIDEALAGMRSQLVQERLSRARYDIENHLPRALAADDLIWADESKGNALNEIIRAVDYLNGRFLRRLKGVEADIEQFQVVPSDFSGRLRRIAAAPAARVQAELGGLYHDVLALAGKEPGGAPEAE